MCTHTKTSLVKTPLQHNNERFCLIFCQAEVVIDTMRCTSASFINHCGHFIHCHQVIYFSQIKHSSVMHRYWTECHLWWTVNRKAVLFMSTGSTEEQSYGTKLQLKDFLTILLCWWRNIPDPMKCFNGVGVSMAVEKWKMLKIHLCFRDFFKISAHAKVVSACKISSWSGPWTFVFFTQSSLTLWLCFEKVDMFNINRLLYL